jgi:hypothetical protein
MTGAVEELLDELPQEESNAHSIKKIETATASRKTSQDAKNAFLLLLEICQLLCFQAFTQISINRMLLLGPDRPWLWIEN